ncbi:MAG: hypothetical protein ACTSV7_13900 [Candidatus Baldrarchaeia archaeon]
MGFESLIATVFIVTIVFMVVGLLYVAHQLTLKMTIDSLKDFFKRENENLKTAIKIVEITPLNNTTIRVKVNNTGSVTLKKSDFKKWDIIAKYYTNNSNTIYERLNYTSLPSKGCWIVESLNEYTNPGNLDPHESISFLLYTTYPLSKNQTSNYILISTNNGITDIKNFKT